MLQWRRRDGSCRRVRGTREVLREESLAGTGSKGGTAGGTAVVREGQKKT